MSASEIPGLRAQILANAKIMLRDPTTDSPIPAGLQAASSQSTLTTATGGYYGNIVSRLTFTFALSPRTNAIDPQDIVIFGSDKDYVAAVMVGLTPAIESASANTPEGAMRRLLVATAEMLSQFIPKLGAHQRAIHGGGLFDEDLIAGDIKR